MQENLKISYERTYDRKDWQGGTRLGLSTLQGGGRGIRDVQLVFFLTKR